MHGDTHYRVLRAQYSTIHKRYSKRKQDSSRSTPEVTLAFEGRKIRHLVVEGMRSKLRDLCWGVCGPVPFGMALVEKTKAATDVEMMKWLSLEGFERASSRLSSPLKTWNPGVEVESQLHAVSD